MLAGTGFYLFASVVADIRIAAWLFFIVTAQVRRAAKAKLHTCASVKAMFMHQLHQKFPSGISSRVLRHICLL